MYGKEKVFWYVGDIGDESFITYLVCIKGDMDVKESFGCLKNLYDFSIMDGEDLKKIFAGVGKIFNVYLGNGYSDMLFISQGKYYVLRTVN